jgi:hypothetical protein
MSNLVAAVCATNRRLSDYLDATSTINFCRVCKELAAEAATNLALRIMKGVPAAALIECAGRIAALGDIVQLHLRKCNSQQLSNLSLKTSLVSLSLVGNEEISTVEPLVALDALCTLDLQYCSRLTNIGPLSACIQLRSLNLRRCYAISDLEPLASCSKLQLLNLYETRASDLTPLASCVELEDLHLGYCTRVKRIDALQTCTQLKFLILYKTSVSDVSPLRDCVALQVLDLERLYDLKTIEPLALASGSLTQLNLGSTGVTDLLPLVHSKTVHSLVSLTLRDCVSLNTEALLPLLSVASDPLSPLASLDVSGTAIDPRLVYSLQQENEQLKVTTGWATSTAGLVPSV